MIDHVGPHLNAVVQNTPEDLYLTKNYELKCFTADNKQGFLSNNFLIRINNSLITALNATEYALPSAIVIMIDNRYLKEDYFGDRHLPQLIDYLLQGVIDTIRKRKRQLTYPFWEEHQPRLIFLRPIPRPAYSLADPEKYKNIRRKYAQDLEEITTKLRVTLVNLDELNCSQRVLFDDYGNLSDYGIEKFWKSLSDHFRRIDRDEHYAIKKFRAPKKTVATQTYTQTHTTMVSGQNSQQKLYQPPSTPRPHLAANAQPQNSQTMNQWGANYNQNPGNTHQNQFEVKQKNYHPGAMHYQGNYPQNDRYHVNNM